jgi:hypothetical protein
MSMRYFKQRAETDLGDGFVWLGFNGEMPVRQVERYGDSWFSSREDYQPELGPGLVDQPLSVLELGAEHEIDPDEFQRAREASGEG